MGCAKATTETYSAGDAGNRTRCQSYSGCPGGANLTYCDGDAGHQWFGTPYDPEGALLASLIRW